MDVSITRQPIEPAAVLGRVGNPDDGAAVLFLGTIRNHNGGRPVVGLRYSAYAEMAERVLAEIAREAAQRLGGDGDAEGRIAVVHRVGELAVGDVGVAVAVSSAHRAESFAACRYIIDELKRRAPIWKREQYAGGGAEWLDAVEPAVKEVAGE